MIILRRKIYGTMEDLKDSFKKNAVAQTKNFLIR